MHPNHFVCNFLPSFTGFTYTLPSRLGSFLEYAETAFGERDKSWTILGVEFGPKANPQTWYPNFPKRKDVVVQMSMNAADDETTAIYQLAHECIHLLSPTGDQMSLVLEEGLATAFSEDVVKQICGVSVSSGIPAYDNAAVKVRELVAVAPDAIRQLRKIQPVFQYMNADTFKLAGVQAPDELIASLVSPFVM